MAMKVSVIIPTYNDEGTIAAAVESALAQRFDGGFEVIVVNDGSNDGTQTELLKFGDRIRLIDQANAGVAAARNAGIAAAAGEYIALLDGDDRFTEDKLSKTVAVLDRNPGCVAVFSNIVQVDSAGREVSRYVTPEFAHPPTMDEMLERPWPYLPSALVIRRETLMAVGGFPHDFTTAARILTRCCWCASVALSCSCPKRSRGTGSGTLASTTPTDR
jgi:glycosyltransferase involved in cell wall biosynthesis